MASILLENASKFFPKAERSLTKYPCKTAHKLDNQ